MPPCKHIILSSIIVAKGKYSNNLFTLLNTESSSFGSSPNLLAHSSLNPKLDYYIIIIIINSLF